MGLIERFKNAFFEVLEKRLDDHREESMLTCAGNCWCWTIEGWLNKKEIKGKWIRK